MDTGMATVVDMRSHGSEVLRWVWWPNNPRMDGTAALDGHSLGFERSGMERDTVSARELVMVFAAASDLHPVVLAQILRMVDDTVVFVVAIVEHRLRE